ncbi:MAG: nucleobase:cation symporter-2 family protein [Christensenellaceae bacterium]
MEKEKCDVDVEESETEILYNIDDKPPMGKAILFALQHILAMFAANVTVPMLVVSTMGLSSKEGTFLIQCALLMAGVVTAIQVWGLGPVGAKLPIVMGTSNAFLSTVLSITSQFGIGACFGASFIGGLFETFLGSFIGKLKKIFNPLVSGIVVMTIGMTLIPTGIRQAAGAHTAAGIGAPINLMLAGIVVLVIVLCNRSSSKFLRASSILVGIVAGYLVAICMGIIDFSPIGAAQNFSIPLPMQYHWEFKWPAIVAMLFMYLATTIETVGDMSALTTIAQNRQPTPKENRGGILADGLGSALAAVFNAFPNTSYTQNIGVVNLTGVFSKSVVLIGAAILALMSLFPKVSAVILCVPEPVLGGATLVTFTMVFLSGLSLIRTMPLNSRNLLIMAVSIGIGVGFSLVPEVTAAFGSSLSVCLNSGIVPASLIAIALDNFLPKKAKKSA